MAEIIAGSGRLFIAAPGTPLDASLWPSAWKLLGETQVDGIVTTPKPMTLAEMRQLVDRLTVVIVCHPDDQARVEAAVEQLRATGPICPVEVVTSPHVDPGQLLSMSKADAGL